MVKRKEKRKKKRRKRMRGKRRKRDEREVEEESKKRRERKRKMERLEINPFPFLKKIVGGQKCGPGSGNAQIGGETGKRVPTTPAPFGPIRAGIRSAILGLNIFFGINLIGFWWFSFGRRRSSTWRSSADLWRRTCTCAG